MLELLTCEKLVLTVHQMSLLKPNRHQAYQSPENLSQKVQEEVSRHHTAEGFDSNVSHPESSGSAPQTLAPPAQGKSGGRTVRTPRRAGAQPVRLQALDDSLGPLGPLGDNAPTPKADEPPAPPQKEQTVTHNLRQPLVSAQSSTASRSLLDPVDLNEDLESSIGPRIPPPVQPSQGAFVRRESLPSVSIEQAAKPTFNITVGDPHKVGDLTSSHIVYSVETKVGCVASRSLSHELITN